MGRQIDKLLDASLINARFKVIARLTCHKTSIQLSDVTEKERITQREECSLCAGLLCGKTQTQSAELLCSRTFVFCKEQAAAGCCYFSFSDFNINLF